MGCRGHRGGGDTRPSLPQELPASATLLASAPRCRGCLCHTELCLDVVGCCQAQCWSVAPTAQGGVQQESKWVPFIPCLQVLPAPVIVSQDSSRQDFRRNGQVTATQVLSKGTSSIATAHPAGPSLTQHRGLVARVKRSRLPSPAGSPHSPGRGGSPQPARG